MLSSEYQLPFVQTLLLVNTKTSHFALHMEDSVRKKMRRAGLQTLANKGKKRLVKNSKALTCNRELLHAVKDIYCIAFSGKK